MRTRSAPKHHLGVLGAATTTIFVALSLAGCSSSSTTDKPDNDQNSRVQANTHTPVHAVPESEVGATNPIAVAVHPRLAESDQADTRGRKDQMTGSNRGVMRDENAAQAHKPSNEIEAKITFGAQDSSAASVSGRIMPTPMPESWPPNYAADVIDRENYNAFDDNPIYQVATDPVSTFSIDVDTAAYANARRVLNSGQLPRHDAVRTEEFINYFNYDYASPKRGGAPFSITTEVGPSPWNNDRRLMLIGLQGYDLDTKDLPPANLVFLIDVSGSMRSPDKLGLLKSSMKLLINQLRPEDTISIAVYAGAAGEVLAPTSGRERRKILAALDALQAGGSTNGGAGIRLAYSLAQAAFDKRGINRIIVATDGDFNVGTTNASALRELVERERESGTSLSVLGFGTGNYNDALMQDLAQVGNGNAAYIDTLNEARKVLVDELGSTLETIAKDVKIQVEFNPATVSAYRLIGYETRHLEREDFNNDAVDAGDIGAGHTVTALYELTLAGARSPTIDELRYGNAPSVATGSDRPTRELAHLKLRYKLPNSQHSRLLSRVVHNKEIRRSMRATSDNYRFAAAASGFGQLLRGGKYTNDLSYADLVVLANAAKGADSFGYRSEFVTLLRTAAALTPQPIAARPSEAPSLPNWRDQQWPEKLTMVQPEHRNGQPQD